MSERIELHDPDPDWPKAFARERDLIAPFFATPPLLIEHIGSTAVPGLAAKPVIDVLVLVEDLDAARRAIPALEATGYSFWADNPDKSRLYLVRGLPPAPRRTHHLHILADAEEARRHTMFRDYLRSSPERRNAYLAIKQALAEKFADDREAYTEGKSAFIDEVMALLGGPARRIVS